MRSTLAAYGAVLTIPGVQRFAAGGFLLRLATAMLGLGVLLLLTQRGRDYGTAGLVSGSLWVGQLAVAPWISRAMDRHGQRRVGAPFLLLHLAALAALLTASLLGAPLVVLVPAALVVGASVPQAGAMVRARWAAGLRGDPRLATAFALESLVEETVFVVGPVLVTSLTLRVGDAAGLAAVGLVVAVGGWLLLGGRSGRFRPEALPRDLSRGRRPGPGAVVALVVFALFGAFVGFVEVGIVAIGRERGQSAWTGICLGVWAAGSLLCGTWFGARHWRGPVRVRLLASAAGLAVGAVLIATAPDAVPARALLLGVAGAANAPLLISASLLLERSTRADAITSAFTWVNAAAYAGSALGTVAAGVVTDAAGGRASLLGAATVGGVLLVVTLVAQRPVAAALDTTPTS